MILSRLVSLFLRFGEFVSGAVVLGIIADFLHRYHKSHVGPHGREIYTVIIAALSVVLSLIWMIPTTSSILHYPADLILALAWFAAFGVLVNYIHHINCGPAFHWGGLTNGSYCGEWKAAEAFSFISACFWLASAILGIYVYHRLRGEPGPSAVATDGTARRRRWGGRRSAV